MAKTPDIVILFDVDNTLIDNDRVQAHLSEHLEQTYGAATRDRYWEIFEQLRSELGYADYLGALERYRIEALHLVRHLAVRYGLNLERMQFAEIGNLLEGQRGVFDQPHGGRLGHQGSSHLGPASGLAAGKPARHA